MKKKEEKGKERGPFDLFEVWKEYERIAMHFNELLLQLRMRALAGIAAITALVGVLSKGETPADFGWGVISAVLFVLAIVWLAVWMIDAKYYTRLLLGAVNAVLHVENNSCRECNVDRLDMSHQIKQAVEGDPEKFPFWKDVVFWFYGIVFVALLFGAYFSLGQHCSSATEDSFAHTHGMCRVETWFLAPENATSNER